MRWHSPLPSRWQGEDGLAERSPFACRNHNCLLPGAALHHWPPIPAASFSGGSGGSTREASSLPSGPDHITQAAPLWCGSGWRSVQTPGHNHMGQLRAGPRPAVGSLWKNIFECLPHSLALLPLPLPPTSPPPPTTCCSHFQELFMEGGV